MKNKKFFNGITRNVVILGFVSLFTDLSSQMVFPLIPLFLTGVLGASMSIVGIVEGASESVASLLKYFSGAWSDKIKKRKPFILFGYGLSSIAKPLFAFVTFWPFVLLIKIVDRFGKGVRTSPRDALVSESTENNFRGKSFGFQRSMDGLGSLLGALLAFILLPIFGFRNVFLLAIIPGIFVIISILLIREKNDKKSLKKVKKEEIDDLETKQVNNKFLYNLELRKNFSLLSPNLKLLIIATAIFAFGHFGFAFLILKAVETGFAYSTAIMFYAIYFFVFTIFSFPVGVLSDKVGRKRIVMMGYFLFSIVCAGMILANSFTFFLLFFVLYGISMACVDGSQRAFVTDLSPKNLKATSLGALHMAIGLTALPGAFIAGLMWDLFGSGYTFIFGITFSISAILLLKFVKS